MFFPRSRHKWEPYEPDVTLIGNFRAVETLSILPILSVLPFFSAVMGEFCR